MSSINTNVMSLNTQRALSSTSGSLATTLQRLSSGLRVNSAKDDAAGLAIAERMSSQVRGMNVAVRNANDGISLAQTAEGALGKVGDMMQRMRELAVQSANATNSVDDQISLQKEFGQLQDEIGRTLDNTKFNGQQILKADSGASALTFQIGAGTGTDDRIDVTRIDLDGASQTGKTILKSASTDSTATATTSAIRIFDDTTEVAAAGTNPGVSRSATTGATNARSAIDAIDKALNEVNSKRAELGAVQNRFDSVISNLQTSVENQSAARGRIMDADFAKETANLSRLQVLQQAGSAMLSQANAMPNNVLSLLR